MSIIEVWLHPPEREPIFFYAKFVRFSPETQTLAIRIIDIERDQMENYRDFIMAHAEEDRVRPAHLNFPVLSQYSLSYLCP